MYNLAKRSSFPFSTRAFECAVIVKNVSYFHIQFTESTWRQHEKEQEMKALLWTDHGPITRDRHFCSEQTVSFVWILDAQDIRLQRVRFVLSKS